MWPRALCSVTFTLHCFTAEDMPQTLLSQGSSMGFTPHAAYLLATEQCQISCIGLWQAAPLQLCITWKNLKCILQFFFFLLLLLTSALCVYNWTLLCVLTPDLCSPYFTYSWHLFSVHCLHLKFAIEMPLVNFKQSLANEYWIRTPSIGTESVCFGLIVKRG